MKPSSFNVFFAATAQDDEVMVKLEEGREVMRAAANSNLKPVSLELGGKSPFIIFYDADLDKAVELALVAVVYNKVKFLLRIIFLFT